MSTEAYDVLSESRYSFGRWLAGRLAECGLVVGILGGTIAAGQLILR